jgi:diguanylate cyclase (GGDEF)-like protein/PAS domain S-box-containing protein
VYYVAGRFGLALAIVHPSASAVWAPTGIALASLLVLGTWTWPALALGALVVNLATSGAILPSLGITTGNTLEALAGAYLVNRYARGHRAFERAPDAFRFALFAAFASTALSATLGVTSLVLGHLASWQAFGSIWLTWWLGDAAGAITVTPFLVLWSERPRAWLSRREALEALLLLVALVLVGMTVFCGLVPTVLRAYPLSFLCFPILVWAAYRFGPRGAATATCLLAGIAIWGTLRALGPFGAGSRNTSLLLLQGFMGTAALMTLILAAVVSERRRSELELRAAHDDLERKICDRTQELSESNEELRREIALRERADRLFRAVAETANDAIVSADHRGQIAFFNAAAERIFGYLAHEVLGRPLTLLLPERVNSPRREELHRSLTNLLRRVTGRTVEMTGRRKDGSEFPLDLSLSTWTVNGETFFTAVLRDISRRKRAEVSVSKLAAIVESSDAAIIGLSPQGVIDSWNPAAERFYGYSAQEVLGNPVTILAPPGKQHEAEENFERLRRGEHVQYETQRMKRDGTILDVHLTVSSIKDTAGRIAGYSAILRDISEARRAEAERQASALMRTQLAELSTRTWEITLLNEMSSMLRAAGSLAEAYPLIPRFLQDLFPGDSGALYVFGASRELLEAVARWGDVRPELDLFQPDDCWGLRRGQLHWVDSPNSGAACRHVAAFFHGMSLCIPIIARGETIGILHWRFAPRANALPDRAENPVAEYRQRLAKTVAEQLALALANVQLHETLRSQASQDPITGLANRRSMETALRREVHRSTRRGTKLGIVMLDLDHFKDVNDKFGHEAGDAALREVGAFLARSCRGEDVVCRFGGEEFLLVLPDCSLQDVVARAEEIRNGIGDLVVEHRGRRLRNLTASVGVALCPEHGSSPEAIVRAADAALYRSKDLGRNRVTVSSTQAAVRRGGVGRKAAADSGSA